MHFTANRFCPSVQQPTGCVPKDELYLTNLKSDCHCSIQLHNLNIKAHQQIFSMKRNYQSYDSLNSMGKIQVMFTSYSGVTYIPAPGIIWNIMKSDLALLSYPYSCFIFTSSFLFNVVTVCSYNQIHSILLGADTKALQLTAWLAAVHIMSIWSLKADFLVFPTKCSEQSKLAQKTYLNNSGMLKHLF